MEYEYVTKRKLFNKGNRSQDELPPLNKTTGNTEQNSFISLSSTSSEVHRVNSLPDLSTHCPQELYVLKDTVKELQVKLTKAYLDIEELTRCKRNLEDKLTENEKKVNDLLEICSASNLIKSKKRESIRKSIYINSSAIKRKINFEATETSEEEIKQPPPLSSNFTQTESLEQESKNKVEDQAQKIWIVGGNKLVDLGSQLTLLRLNNKYEHYKCYSICKPGATTSEILKSIETFTIKQGDKVVISIGENDANPLQISHELYYSLKKLENNDTLVISTEGNPFLNNTKINDNLELTCKLFKNCYFLRSDRYSLCNLVSYKIDCLDYDRKFIGQVNKVLKNCVQYCKSNKLISSKKSIVTNKVETVRKGTIPYYFKKKIKELVPQANVPFYFYFGVQRQLEVNSMRNNNNHTTQTFFRK